MKMTIGWLLRMVTKWPIRYLYIYHTHIIYVINTSYYAAEPVCNQTKALQPHHNIHESLLQKFKSKSVSNQVFQQWLCTKNSLSAQIYSKPPSLPRGPLWGLPWANGGVVPLRNITENPKPQLVSMITHCQSDQILTRPWIGVVAVGNQKKRLTK